MLWLRLSKPTTRTFVSKRTVFCVALLSKSRAKLYAWGVRVHENRVWTLLRRPRTAKAHYAAKVNEDEP